MNEKTNLPIGIEIEFTAPKQFKYEVNDVVQHYKGGIYVVAGLPDEYVIESTREAAYAYRMADGRKAVRCQVEFEDPNKFIWLGKAHLLGLPAEPIPVMRVRT